MNINHSNTSYQTDDLPVVPAAVFTTKLNTLCTGTYYIQP